MDALEFVLCFLLLAVGGSWAFRAGRRGVFLQGRGSRALRQVGMLYPALLAGCLGALWICLATLAEPNVRRDGGVQALFLASGLAAIAVATEVMGVLGVHALDDGIERDNPGARLAAGGLWIAVTLCTIGANLGRGDFVGTTFVPLALALIGLLGAIGIHALVTDGLAPVAVGRSRAAGVRLAGLALAVSLPLAQAASGDWISLGATLRDFAATLPVVAGVVALAAGFERRAVRIGGTGAADAGAEGWRWGVGLAAALVALAGAATAALLR